MSIGVSSGLQFEDEFQLLAHNLLNPIQSTPEENKRTSDAPKGSGGPSVGDLAQDEHLDKSKDQAKIPIRPNPFVPQLPSPQSPTPIIPTGSFS